MSIRLFSRTGFNGDSHTVTSDISDLRNTPVGTSTSSLRFTENDDRALFYTEPNWRGQVMFRDGITDISNTGKTARGGKSGFNNNICSVRITPFEFRVNYIVVIDDRDLPGSHNEDHTGLGGVLSLLQQVGDAHEVVQGILRPYLLDAVRLPTLSTFDSRVYFDLTHGAGTSRELGTMLGDADFPWRYDAFNVVLVNSLTNSVGTNSTLLGNRNLGAAIVEVRPDDELFGMGRTIAHEMVHALGIRNHGANNDPSLLMTQTGNVTGPLTDAVNLTDGQAETIHETLVQAESMVPANAIRVE